MIVKTALQGHNIYNIWNMSGMIIEYRTRVWSGMIIELENKGKVRNGYWIREQGYGQEWLLN